MKFEEFLKPTVNTTEPAQEISQEVSAESDVTKTEEINKNSDAPIDSLAQEMMAPEKLEEIDDSQQLEVSNAVVEELARDSVEQQETIKKLRKKVSDLQSEIAAFKLKIEQQNIALAKVGETLAKNSEVPESTKVTLLERDTELPDRFKGETRDHVLEALKEAHDTAEKDGRLRHAQILESVLCANEPNGNLAKKREELKKLFEANANLVSGPVIEELQRRGISYKNGEEYLLPSEILKRTY